jgi:hypothetical protein
MAGVIKTIEKLREEKEPKNSSIGLSEFSEQGFSSATRPSKT